MPALAGLGIAEDMRVPPDHLRRDRLDHVRKGEGADLVSHLSVIDDLQEEVAKLLAQIVHILTRDRVRDLVGFLDRVWRDGLEGLLDIPRAAALPVP